MGPDHFVAVMKYGGMPLDEAEASMRLFAKEALPAVKALPVPPLRARAPPSVESLRARSAREHPRPRRPLQRERRLRPLRRRCSSSSPRTPMLELAGCDAHGTRRDPRLLRERGDAHGRGAERRASSATSRRRTRSTCSPRTRRAGAATTPSSPSAASTTGAATSMSTAATAVAGCSQRRKVTLDAKVGGRGWAG